MGYPYIWVTWFTKLLANEDQCWGAAWYRAHQRGYRKRVDESSNLDEWRREHDAMVAESARRARGEGCEVHVEDENKMSIRGKVAIVGAKPDLVASGPKVATIIDCKTGRPKDSHQWQVRVYMLLAPEFLEHVKGRAVYGSVEYPGGLVDVGPLTDQQRQEIGDAIRRVASDEPAPFMPSSAECRYCDIADCAVRIDASNEKPTSLF